MLAPPFILLSIKDIGKKKFSSGPARLIARSHVKGGLDLRKRKGGRVWV